MWSWFEVEVGDWGFVCGWRYDFGSVCSLVCVGVERGAEVGALELGLSLRLWSGVEMMAVVSLVPLFVVGMVAVVLLELLFVVEIIDRVGALLAVGVGGGVGVGIGVGGGGG